MYHSLAYFFPKKLQYEVANNKKTFAYVNGKDFCKTLNKDAPLWAFCFVSLLYITWINKSKCPKRQIFIKCFAKISAKYQNCGLRIVSSTALAANKFQNQTV